MKILVGVLTTILVVTYPLAIWYGLTHVSARTVSLWVLALIVPGALYRFRAARREDLFAVLRIPVLVAVVVGCGALLDDRRFVLATPVLISLVLMVSFAASLRGTTVIERFARMQAGDAGLSEAQVRHCRQVTWAWVAFFCLNGTVAAMLSTDEAWVGAWAAYNGGIAYALMGVMFVGEYLLRRYRFREYGGGLHDRLLSRIFPPREETP